ncbi:MAG TPA: RodZ domain-containing protein [Candidatus Baltobacteraceae bacterium]|nr:RodZ domain-containing protein [Candidatus Baltobacteraceae bacterium]
MSLGERFRAAREQRGLTLSDVAEHLRIRSVYLAAIEEENWKAIGAPVYIRGFLRTYARYLGLDPEEAVSAFNATEPAAPAPTVSPSARSRAEYRSPSGPMSPLIWVASIIALALIGFVVYLYVTPAHTQPQVAVASGEPTAPSLTNGSSTQIPATAMPSASVSAAPVAPALKTLVIHLTAPSWLRVSVDGNVSIEGTFPAGTTKTFHGKLALVRVGNAGGVQLTVDGKPLGKLGGSGDVVEKSFVL